MQSAFINFLKRTSTMKNILLFALLLTCAGCSSGGFKPINYDLSTSATYPSINASRNIPNIEIETFTYEPPVSVSQHSISHLGCLPCASDGSTSGSTFSQPIRDIITAEVKAAINETMLREGPTKCKLTGQIHLAAFNVMDGDTNVDITYILRKEGALLSLKRMPGHYERGTFEFSADVSRWMAEPVRDSVSKLMDNKEFIDLVNQECKIIKS